MTRMVARAGIGRAVRRALALMGEHRGIDAVGAPQIDEARGVVTVDVTFAVNLPSEWRRRGESPSGVRLREEVRFGFPNGFPMDPPWLSLRADFSRNLPHIQPWLVDGRPVPCIYDGHLSELLHKEGFGDILNQTSVWLERAALGTLIDPEQGWEPVRRDSLDDVVVANAGDLLGLVDRRGGHRFLYLGYLRAVATDGTEFVQAQVSSKRVIVNRKAVAQLFAEVEIDRETRLRRGRSLALIVWPGKQPSGEPIVCDSYFPETVDDVARLKRRAELYGCARDLNDGLNWLRRSLAGWSSAESFKMIVILLARRPFKVIGSESPIELCPYVVDVQAPDLFADSGSTTVRPAGHCHAITRSLLTHMAGQAATADRPPWTLLGAGSLGSKLALHLARAGNGPEVVVDRSTMSPHNAARHALIPGTDDLQILWTDDKARLLSQALGGLDQSAKPIRANAAHMAIAGDHSRDVWSRESWAVVNATASLAVREALGASEAVRARVVETSLFAGGRVGAITVEGPDRNPSTTDLAAAFYAFMHERPDLGSITFNRDDPVSRRSTGHGCGSLTMAMSDGRVSLFAAGMSEYLLTGQREGLPEGDGEVLIGRLSDDGLGVVWGRWRILPVIAVQTGNGNAWRVHIHARALAKMQEEAARWPDVETGGVLVGRLSEVARVAHVVDVMEAPEDSHRASNEFVLGTQGLRQRLQAYSERVGWSLYCLGTWHSHLGPGGPSATDRATARAVSLARLTPSIFLILTPVGFHALAADT